MSGAIIERLPKLCVIVLLLTFDCSIAVEYTSQISRHIALSDLPPHAFLTVQLCVLNFNKSYSDTYMYACMCLCMCVYVAVGIIF